jgi:hypothetical protein
LIRQQILCEEVPDPPASIGGMPIPPPPATISTGTTRDAYLAHVQKGANGTTNPCADCHNYMDYIGFGFDNYDATGAYITFEVSKDSSGNSTQNPVDSSGQFMPYPNSTDINQAFSGTTDMITKLSQAPQVNQCFALEELRYALLRAETDADACSAQAIYKTFSNNNGYKLQDLIVAVVSSDAFMYRTPVTAGSACQ